MTLISRFRLNFIPCIVEREDAKEYGHSKRHLRRAPEDIETCPIQHILKSFSLTMNGHYQKAQEKLITTCAQVLKFR